MHIPHGCLPRPSRMDAVCSDLVQGTRSQFITPQGRPPPRLLYLPFLLIFCPLVVKKKIKVYPADSQPEVSRERSTIESLELLPMRASRPSLESGREKKHSGKCHRLRFHPPPPHPQFTINLIFSSPPKIALHRALLALPVPCLCRNMTLDRPCSCSRSIFHFSFFVILVFHNFYPSDRVS